MIEKDEGSNVTSIFERRTPGKGNGMRRKKGHPEFRDHSWKDFQTT